MKKLLLLLLVFAGFLACENEIIQELPQEVSKTEGITAKKNQKIDVCHKGKIINVSANALGGHQGHGDAIDWDADGYFDLDNPCSEKDCDDTDATINPSAEEIVYNGVDEDCNPATLDDDLDEDGFLNADDCDDTNAAVNPGMDEIVYNGVDDDCNPATLDDDLDEDGFTIDVDCDDTNAAVNPGVVEVCNGIDDNCNGATDENCNPCLDDAINQVSVLIIEELGGTDLSSTITSSNTFLIFWNSNGRDGRDCIETTAEVTGDLETVCGYVNLHHESVPCP